MHILSRHIVVKSLTLDKPTAHFRSVVRLHGTLPLVYLKDSLSRRKKKIGAYL